MTKAEELSHLSDMIRASIDTFLLKMNGADGYLPRLKKIADEGGYITAETTEAIRLENDASVLRALAVCMMNRRAALLANEPQYHIAAE